MLVLKCLINDNEGGSEIEILKVETSGEFWGKAKINELLFLAWNLCRWTEEVDDPWDS